MPLRLKLSFAFSLIALASVSSCSRTHEPKSVLTTDAVGRHILGPAVALELTAPEDSDKIKTSLIATRTLAWNTFAKVVQNVAQKVPAPEDSSRETIVPRVFTWYSPEDVNRLLGFGLSLLSPDANDKGSLLTDEEWEQSQTLLSQELDTLPLPLQKKWSRFFDNNSFEASSVIGASGLNRTLFSPELIKAVTQRYADLQSCFPNDQKPSPLQSHNSCWNKPLPRSSVMVKTTWVNSEAGFYKIATDADSLRTLMAEGNVGWERARIKSETPDASRIVTAHVNNKAYVLGGIHIVSKELDDWLWISAWWSDDPDHDFGEDRPESVKKLGAPWNQYKICAVSSYGQDQKELGALAQTSPTLAAAYRAALDATGSSWCSNPYIEKGAGNQKTNCIGCHQFAGTDVTQEEILSDATRFPNYGKSRQRNDFPSDYIWSATQGQISWLATLNSLRFPSSNKDSK